MENPIQRRVFLQSITTLLAMTGVVKQSLGNPTKQREPEHDMSKMPENWTGKERIAMLLYPSCTSLDFAGPQYMFGCLMGAQIYHVAKTREPIVTDTRLTILPDTTFDECPKDVDIFFVPGGGTGLLEVMQDRATLEFVAQTGGRAKWLTSVCTGSMLLAAAGLLKNYQATSHWTTRDLLSLAGAIPTDRRVVKDRNRITAAGVSAGLDLGLYMVGLLRDKSYAESVQLLAEYDPDPPYHSGSVHSASAETKLLLDDMFKDFVGKVEASLKKTNR